MESVWAKGMTWRRFENYRVMDDSYVVPAGEEVDSYNPVQQYLDFLADETYEYPHMSLREIDVTARSDVLRWVRRFGLIGIVPHEVWEIVFWPRWGEFHHGDVTVKQSVYRNFQTPTSEDQDGRIPNMGIEESSVSASSIQPGTYCSADQIRALFGSDPTPEVLFNTHRVPQVLCSPVDKKIDRRGFPFEEGTFRRRSFFDGYVRYLPLWDESISPLVRWGTGGDEEAWVELGEGERFSEPRSYEGQYERAFQEEVSKQAFPVPFSDSFWAHYGEPIHELQMYLDVVQTRMQTWLELENAPETLSAQDLASGPPYEKWDDAFNQLLQAINRTLTRVSPQAALQNPEAWDEEPYWGLSWQCHSLFGMLHLMMLNDLLSDRAPTQCAHTTCDRIFLSTDPRQEYCSQQCKRASNRRRQRGKKRQCESLQTFLEDHYPQVLESWPHTEPPAHESIRLMHPIDRIPELNEDERTAVLEWVQDEQEDDKTYNDLFLEKLSEDVRER